MTIYTSSSDSDEFSEDEFGIYINASPKKGNSSFNLDNSIENFNMNDAMNNIYKSNLLSKCFGGWVYFINNNCIYKNSNHNNHNNKHLHIAYDDFNQKSFISLSLIFSQLIFYKKGINNWINFTKEQINKRIKNSNNNNYSNNNYYYNCVNWINIKRLFNKLKYRLNKRKSMSKNMVNCSSYKKLAKYSIHLLFSDVFKRSTRMNSDVTISRYYSLRLLRINFKIWSNNSQKSERFIFYISFIIVHF